MENLIKFDNAVVISDLHVADPDTDGATGKSGLDDFDRDEDFVRLLGEIIPRRAGEPATLIINGDFIDFIQILPGLGRHSVGDRFGVTQNESCLKLERAIKSHPLVFKALADFLKKGNQVLVLPGNHDIDFHWPNVFESFRKELGGVPEPMLQFVRQAEIHEQGVHIEHGNQYSYDNRFDFWLNPIRQAPDGRERLERPWGTLFLDVVYNDVKDGNHFSNKVYPHWKLGWIALRSWTDDKHASARDVARLILFFAGKGKRFLWGHVLGSEDEDKAVPIDAIWERLGPVEEGRHAEISAEINLLLNEAKEKFSFMEKAPANVSPDLGQSDDRGMLSRQMEILREGDVDIVVFGHTHDAVDGNKNPVLGTGDVRRSFNTGSWVPKIPLSKFEKLRWSDLDSKPSVSDIEYLVLSLKPRPTASLEPLLPPDRG
jgi:UDP-2,3-diacylglucosamine pyrophosphatase LpxH